MSGLKWGILDTGKIEHSDRRMSHDDWCRWTVLANLGTWQEGKS